MTESGFIYTKRLHLLEGALRRIIGLFDYEWPVPLQAPVIAAKALAQLGEPPLPIAGMTVEPGRFDTGGDDHLEVLHRDGLFDFEIEEPWAGDTERGFGARCDLSLNREQAVALAHWILDEASTAAAQET